MASVALIYTESVPPMPAHTRDGVVMGHEFCGEVVAIGAGVNGWSIGERVPAVTAWFCEQRDNCQQGKPFQCQNLQGIGFDIDRAYAEYLRIKATTAVRIPDHLSDAVAVAVLYEPLSVALQAFRRGNIAEADNVLVLGGGPIGLSLAMLAKHFGAKFVGLSELQPERLKRTGACGANMAGIKAINDQLTGLGNFAVLITVYQSKYLNNIVEQVVRHSDHRFIKKITRPMPGFKSFASTEATLVGIELHHIISKGQLDLEEATPFEQFYALAG